MAMWTRQVTEKRKRFALLKVFLPGIFGFDETFGMLDDVQINAALQHAFGETQFSDLVTPLLITATDFHSGEMVILREGQLTEAIRASIAMPYIFGPYSVGDRLLVDGYLSDPLPIGVAINAGASVILAIGFESPYQASIHSLPRFSFQVNSIMANNLLKANFAYRTLVHHSEVILIAPQFGDRIRLFDTEKIPAIIETGRQSAAEQLPLIEEILAAVKT